MSLPPPTGFDLLQRRPAGPVANAYEQSRADLSCILGPTGGGKTISSTKKVLRVAQWQDPSPRDGVRRARIACVASTYRELWDKVIPSYRKTYPEEVFGKIRGSRNDLAEHRFKVKWPGFGVLDVEVLFRAIRDADLEDFVRGLEVTAWWLTEMDTLPEALPGLALNRTGRYPEPEDRPEPVEGRPPAYAGVFGDANVPDIDSWFYNKFWLRENRPEHWALFMQPPGDSPEAENLDNLRKIRPDYYANLRRNQEDWQNRRFIECKPGYSRHGQPVHPDFDEVRHVAAERLKADPRLPVIIGGDGGSGTLRPAATFKQRDLQGRWRVLAEFAPEEQTGVEDFGRNIKRILNTEIRHAAGAVIIGDPAMNARLALGGVTYAQALQHHSGVEVRLASSQDPDVRRSALRRVLQRHGGFTVDPRCTALIKALAGAWRYRKVAGKLSPIPEKSHPYSDIGEGCEYGVLGGEGVEGFDNGFGGDPGEADFPNPVL